MRVRSLVGFRDSLLQPVNARTTQTTILRLTFTSSPDTPPDLLVLDDLTSLFGRAEDPTPLVCLDCPASIACSNRKPRLPPHLSRDAAVLGSPTDEEEVGPNGTVAAFTRAERRWPAVRVGLTEPDGVPDGAVTRLSTRLPIADERFEPSGRFAWFGEQNALPTFPLPKAEFSDRAGGGRPVAPDAEEFLDSRCVEVGRLQQQRSTACPAAAHRRRDRERAGTEDPIDPPDVISLDCQRAPAALLEVDTRRARQRDTGPESSDPCRSRTTSARSRRRQPEPSRKGSNRCSVPSPSSRGQARRPRCFGWRALASATKWMRSALMAARSTPSTFGPTPCSVDRSASVQRARSRTLRMPAASSARSDGVDMPSGNLP